MNTVTNAPPVWPDVPVRPGVRAAVRKHWRPLVATLVLVVLVASGVVGYRWRTGLQVFGGAGWSMTGRSVTVGQAYYTDAVVDPGRTTTMTLRSVALDVTSNTAAADYQVLTCHRGGILQLGADRGVPSDCADAPVPFRPGRYTLGPAAGDTVLVIRFTAQQGGVFEFHGVVVSYASGLRHGHQRTGIDQQYRTP